MTDPMHPNRREFIKQAAGAGGLLAASPMLATGLARPWISKGKTRHIVLIAFAGGVRTKETFGRESNIPQLKALADEGVLYTRVRTSNLGHFGAGLSVFTGVSAARGIRENSPGSEPTLFEYLRKGLRLPAGEVWVTTSGGAQQVNYASSLHPNYGPDFGATTLDGDGIFNDEFKRLLAGYGMPHELGAGEERALGRLRGALSGAGQLSQAALDSAARVESYIMQELTRGTAELSGSNAADIKALTLARNLLSVFRPTVVGVVLQDADVAHRSFNGYVEVIRRNDAAVGEIMSVIREDPLLADSTAVVVLPEFGRDRDLNMRRGLDHGDDSDDLNYVTCTAWGPDFGRGKVIDDDVRTIDIVPSLCQLMGVDAPHARGHKLPGLLM
ncbi:MAG: hypothetical protein ACI8QZ_003303 [Chlamydiales bacterium]|jgi:hypothetical protein